MLNTKNTTLKYLRDLNLSSDEAKLYLELLKEPNSHLELSRKTGINRTKVYRLADDLEKRSLISTRTDDRGTFLVASDPEALDIELTSLEEKLKNQKAIYTQVLPTLLDIKSGSNEAEFVIQTYEGIEGFKQMLWHELKSRDELIVFCNGGLENLVDSKRWSEKYAIKCVEAGYKIRILLNPESQYKIYSKALLDNFQMRYIGSGVIKMDHQIAIYNDTVASYCWRGDQKVGVEIINKSNAQMMRQMFNNYWQMAKPSNN